MPFRSLLERARQGDRTAWNTLLASLRPFLRAIVRRRGCPDAAASEFANDALLRIDQAFPRFRGTTSAELRAWSRMVVVNVWRDFCRKKRPPLAPLADDPLDPREAAPDARLMGEEEGVRLAGALARLKPHRRAVLERRFQDDLSCAEVARELGRTEGWVRITTMRACEDLRRFYGRQS